MISSLSVLSLPTLSQRSMSEAGQRLSLSLRAKAAYAKERVKGSDHKDVLGALAFKAAGAPTLILQLDHAQDPHAVEVVVPKVRVQCCREEKLKLYKLLNSTRRIRLYTGPGDVADGMVLFGSPPEKRLALSYVSLAVVALPSITEELASALAGFWISLLMFLGSFFSLCRQSSSSPQGSFLRHFCAGQAQELATMLLLISPVPFSAQMPLMHVAEVGACIASSTWAEADKKGVLHPPVLS